MTAIVLAFPEPRSLITLERLAAIVATAKVDLAREAQAQADMEVHLRDRLPPTCSLEREARLSAQDRPDFLIDGRLVVEMKLSKARGLDVWRQLNRYGKHACVEGMILAGSRGLGVEASQHLPKPFLHVNLGRAWL